MIFMGFAGHVLCSPPEIRERLVKRLDRFSQDNPIFTRQEIKKGEDQDPNEILKVPAKTDVFRQVIAVGEVVSSPARYESSGKEDDSPDDVQPVEAGNHEKGCPEQRIAIRIFRQPQVRAVNEVVPLIGLEAQENHAARDGHEHEVFEFTFIPVFD